MEIKLPFDEQLEKEILGCCMTGDPGYFVTTRSVLSPEDFHLMDHQRIFRSLCRLFDADGALDRTTVYADMRARNEPITLGYLIDLDAPTYALEKHLARAKDLSRRRMLVHRAHLLAGEAADTTTSLDDLAARAQRSIREIYGGPETGSAEEVAGIVDECGGVETMLRPKLGIYSPWQQFNHVTGGWQRGDLALIAARPSMGKTAFALNAVHYAAAKGVPSVLYSYEMSRESLLMRLVSLRTGISYRDIASGELTFMDRHSVREAIVALTDLPLRLVAASGKTVLSIRVHAERLKHKGKCGLIAVDYIGLIRGADREQNRNRELGNVCRQLKEIATQLEVPALVLAQLNRDTEKRPDKRPQMSDLRDSGELEEHADIVTLLHRPGYYNREDPALQRAAEIIVGKQRNGDTPIIPLEFERHSGRFSAPEAA